MRMRGVYGRGSGWENVQKLVCPPTPGLLMSPPQAAGLRHIEYFVRFRCIWAGIVRAGCQSPHSARIK